MYNLFLDDLRFPFMEERSNDVSAYHYTFYLPFKTEEWIIVRNYDDFVKVVQEKGLPTRVAFDHDLGIEHYKQCQTGLYVNYSDFVEKTGYDCAKWLCDYCQDNKLKFPIYFVHSMNPVGSVNIKTYIENYKKHIEND